MDFEQLETFLQVARHSSFSRAAEKRFRTQPAISSQIRALEEELGFALLTRTRFGSFAMRFTTGHDVNFASPRLKNAYSQRRGTAAAR